MAGTSGSKPGNRNPPAIAFRPLSGSVQDRMGHLADSPGAGQDHYLAVMASPGLPASIILTGWNGDSVDDHLRSKSGRPAWSE